MRPYRKPIESFMYISANPVAIDYGNIRMVHIRLNLHKFFRQYAWEYARVRISDRTPCILGTKQAQTIGKAMITHYETTSWERNVFSDIRVTEERFGQYYKMRQDLENNPRIAEKKINLGNAWNLQFMFQFGGPIEIIENNQWSFGTEGREKDLEDYVLEFESSEEQVQEFRRCAKERNSEYTRERF